MPVAHDADPWVRPPVGGREPSGRYGVVRDRPVPHADPSFADFIDILNLLQHVPLLSSLYRHVTGDEIDPAAQVMGATLYGGPLGFVAAKNLAVIQEAASGSPADMMVAALMGPEEGPGDKLAITADRTASSAAMQLAAVENRTAASGPELPTLKTAVDRAGGRSDEPRPAATAFVAYRRMK